MTRAQRQGCLIHAVIRRCLRGRDLRRWRACRPQPTPLLTIYQHREVNHATFLITIAVFHSICKPKLCKVMKQLQSEKKKTIYQVTPLSSAPICTFPGVTAVLLCTQVFLRNNRTKTSIFSVHLILYFMTHYAYLQTKPNLLSCKNCQKLY